MALSAQQKGTSSSSDPLGTTLSRSIAINWEVALYILLFILAIFTRFYMLGDRAMSHDESLHVYYSYNLYADGNFEHSPLMHGPILNHMTAFFYALFGVNDFTGRIYSSLFGVFLVMTPMLFRRWLGRWGALLATTMLLVSPLMMYYNRYIRHDTPSILAAILMFWAIMMYLNGPPGQRRKAYWLYLLSGAMLWNLGSKETSFIYIAVFGLFLMLYWFARMAQQAWKVPGKPLFYGGIMGVVLAGTAGLGMYIILDITPLETIATVNPSFSWYIDLATSSRLLWMLAIFVIVAVILILIAIVTYGLFLLSRQLQKAIKLPHVSTLIVFILSTILALLLFDFIERTLGIFTSIELRSFLVWSVLVAVFMSLVLLSTLHWALRKSNTRIPWREIFALVVFASVVLTGLVIVEELSHISREAVGLAEPIDPAAAEAAGEVVTNATAFSWTPIVLVWALMFILVAGLFWSRRARWWDWLDRFPELDVLMIMGSLILPWLTAFFIIATRGTDADYTAIGSNLPQVLLNALPVLGTVQLGQFFVGFLAWLPLMVIAVVAGLTWNWKRYLVSSLIFHSLFAFFFTTVFTNINGLATGMVYSLQYWLEQQAERRGNQPQYYYLLIIMPMYEFLPIIGSALAMLSGLTIYWRKRINYRQLRDESRQPVLAEAVTDDDGNAIESQTENADAQELTHDHGEFIPEPDIEDEFEYSPLAEPAPPTGDTLELDSLETDYERARYLTHVPFLLFVSWWAVLNLIGYTLAGEKMPWLGTHLTTPMIFLSAWYFGQMFDRLNWNKFRDRGWLYLIVMPFLFIALFQVVAPLFGGTPPFSGISSEQLGWTYSFIGALFISGALMYLLYRLSQTTGTRHLWRMLGISVFVVLSVITFRSAWMASFINYDYATEFLVYAHATPGTKIVMNQLEELSKRTTDGMDLKFAYDNKLSWPGVWYFREYPNAVFMGETPTLQQMDDAMVVLVGEGNRSTVEPLLEDRYQRFEYKRMWWPMMDYFNLNASRMQNFLDFSPQNANSAAIRRGIFDIWWDRDYSTYAEAAGKEITITNWPVAENMYMYVRRDFAQQVWDLGVGDGTVFAAENIEVSACVSNWLDTPASVVFDTANLGMNLPIGLDVFEDRLLVAEDANHRLVEFNTDGEFVAAIGQRGTRDQDGAFFERPNAVAFAEDGSYYVVDTWNYLVRHFAPDGTPLDTWGTPLTVGINAPVEPVDGFWGPRDAAVDAEGNVYVSDTGNKRVRVYTADGTYLRDIGSGGSQPGQLDEPSGLAIHPDGRLFVADTWNRRISVFALDGTFLETYQLRAWYDELGNRPYIDVDPVRNYLYITDPDAGRILVYSTETGECVGAFGQLERETPNASQFATIGGLAVDDEGFVYVSDVATGRILKFESFPETLQTTQGEEVDFVEPVFVDEEGNVIDDNADTGEEAASEEIPPETTDEVSE